MVTLYNATSKDGFVARADGSEDFIPDELWDFFLSLTVDYDALVLSRKAYEAIQSYGPEVAGQLDALSVKKYVLSSGADFVPQAGYGIVHMITDIPSLGTNVLVCSGPTGNDLCVAAGIVDRVLTYELTETIGAGVPQFHQSHRFSELSRSTEPFGTLKLSTVS